MKTIITTLAALCLVSQVLPSALLAQATSERPEPAICFETVGAEEDTPLLSRIGAPDPDVLEIFAGSGAAEIEVHDLSEDERIVVDQALARLPALHRDVLRRHLRRLSFLNLQQGAGSALTSRVGLDETSTQFDITFRASLLDESLTRFMNVKEARLFAEDGSGHTVEFDAGQGDALTYVLLHEATHIVDQVMGLTDDEAGAFRAGIWEDLRTPSEPHASSPALTTPFRRMPPVPLGDSPALYEALRQSPFVTFYATAAAPEDLAELFAWQQLASRFDQTLTLTIRDREGGTVYRYEPLVSPEVQPRFGEVKALLERYERECRASRTRRTGKTPPARRAPLSSRSPARRRRSRRRGGSSGPPRSCACCTRSGRP